MTVHVRSSVVGLVASAGRITRVDSGLAYWPIFSIEFAWNSQWNSQVFKSFYFEEKYKKYKKQKQQNKNK